MQLENRNYPQVHLEECNYKIKKKKMTRFINVELDLNDSDDSNDFDNSDGLNSI